MDVALGDMVALAVLGEWLGSALPGLFQPKALPGSRHAGICSVSVLMEKVTCDQVSHNKCHQKGTGAGGRKAKIKGLSEALDVPKSPGSGLTPAEGIWYSGHGAASEGFEMSQRRGTG